MEQEDFESELAVLCERMAAAVESRSAPTSHGHHPRHSAGSATTMAAPKSPGHRIRASKAPASGTGDAANTYTIERREQATGGAFNEWHQVAIALETEVHLNGEPRNQRLECRIIAINNGGNSVPSNTAAVGLQAR